jgi:ABC-2 type transport system permease protein
VKLTGLSKLVAMEAKLLLRDPTAVFFGVLFPPLLLAVLGSIPGFREPTKDLGGLRVIDIYVPIVIAFVLAMLALSLVPTALATYRERGILRRLATTPLPPARLLLAQMVTGVTTALITVTLVIAVGSVVFGVAMPKQVGGFLLALVLGVASVFAIGLVLAAVAPTGRAASGLGSILFFPMLFFAGLYVPREVMPDVLRRISDFTPLGATVQSLQDATNGAWPSALHLAVMAVATVVAGLAAARLFRWE